MSTLTSANNSIEQTNIKSNKRGCLFYIGRGVKWFFIVLIALVLLGVAYQAVATELDNRAYSPRGQLYVVNGRQMHMICMGEGSPAVILQAGGGADSLWWYWVQNQLAATTRVCAYDRAGLGWSDAASTPRDPVTIVGELHTLLEEAGVQPPYVMVGHSYGSILARVYATQYPQAVTGLALVDSYTVGMVEQSEIDNARLLYYATNAPLYLMQYMGVTRFVLPDQILAMGYPSELVPEMVALRSRNQALATDSDEKGLSAYMALAQASLDASDLGALPVAILWASESYANYNPDAMLEVAGYSTNSVVHVIENSNHGSILGTEQHAQQVSDAILDVIEAAQTGEPLAQ
jgi:pimeloyl-ACP methyl ester carboxylesterase